MAVQDDEQTNSYSDKMKEIDSSSQMEDDEGPSKSNSMKPIDSSSSMEPEEVVPPEPKKRTPQEMMEDPTTITDEHEETQDADAPINQNQPGQENSTTSGQTLDGDRGLDRENQADITNPSDTDDDKIKKEGQRANMARSKAESVRYNDIDYTVWLEDGHWVAEADGGGQSPPMASKAQAVAWIKKYIDDNDEVSMASPSNIKSKYTTGYSNESYTIYQTTDNKWYAKTSAANQVAGPFATEERAEAAAKSMIDDLEPLKGWKMKLQIEDLKFMDKVKLKQLWEDLTLGETEPTKAAITKLSTSVDTPEEFVKALAVKIGVKVEDIKLKRESKFDDSDRRRAKEALSIAEKSLSSAENLYGVIKRFGLDSEVNKIIEDIGEVCMFLEMVVNGDV